MTDFNIQQKQLIKHIKSAEQWLGEYSDEQILSILNGESVKGIKLTEQQKISVMTLKKSLGKNLGLTVEKQDTVKVYDTTTIPISKEEKEKFRVEMQMRVAALPEKLKKAEDTNSFVGSTWSWIKNNVSFLDGITDSSNDVLKQQNIDVKLFQREKNMQEKSVEEIFQELTGFEFNRDNVESFLDGKIQTKAEKALTAFEEGQAMAVDTVTDMAAGAVAVGAYAVGFGLAPVTGGASIAVGLASAATVGALVKTSTKAIDASIAGREYKSDEMLSDVAYGAIAGVVAPFTGCVGGAAGRTVAVRTGVTAVRTATKETAKTTGKALAKKAGKEYLEETAEKSFKQTFKNAMANPTGNKYTGGTKLARGVSELAEVVTDGTMSGMLEGAGRTAWDGGDLSDIADATVAGFVGGLAGSAFIGGGMKAIGSVGEDVAGKISKKLPNNFKNITKDNIKDVLDDMVGEDGYQKFCFRSLFENVEKYDYDNIGRHLQHIEFVIKNDYTNGCPNFIKNGYFSSKEGADYFEYLVKNVKEPKKSSTSTRKNLDLIMSNYSVEDLKKLEKYGLLDKLCSAKDSDILVGTKGMNDKQFENMFKFGMLDKGLVYASENPEVCKLMIVRNADEYYQKTAYFLKDLENRLYSCCDNSVEKVNQLVEKLMKIEDKDMLLYATEFENPAYLVENYKQFEKLFKKYTEQGLNLNNFMDINHWEFLKLASGRHLDTNTIAVLGHCVSDDSIELLSKLIKDINVSPNYIRDLVEVNRLQNLNFNDLGIDVVMEYRQFLASKPLEFFKICDKYDLKVEEIRTKINSILGRSTDVIQVSSVKQKNFIAKFMANNDASVDNVLKNFDFKKYEKQGLPLKYSREDFTDKVYELLDDLNAKEQKELLAHFGMKHAQEGVDGFDGIPLVKSPDIEGASAEVQDAAIKLSAEIDKFMTQNQVMTGNPEVDNVLTALVGGLPEFTAMVGKKQHDTHSFSLDIHTLKVLQTAMNDPIYSSMNDKTKTIFKFATLLHDLGKKGGIDDREHSVMSTKYIDGILDKFSFPQDMKKQIVEVVENHHWFEKYNTGKASADDIAIFCIDPEMFKIYKLFAKTDLSSVSDNFHFRVTGTKSAKEFDKFMDDKFAAIEHSVNNHYVYADFASDTKFVKGGALFPKVKFKIKGKEVDVPVLNFNKLSKNTDMQQYGFALGVKASDVRLLAHMTCSNKECFDILGELESNPLQHEVLSKSLIDPNKVHAYESLNFGKIYEAKQSNIARTFVGSNHNGTSTGKDLSNFRELLDNDHEILNLRGREFDVSRTHNLAIEYFSNHAGVYLSDADYVELCKYIMSKKHTTQMVGKVKIGNQEIDSKYIREFLNKNSKIIASGDSEVVSRDCVPSALLALVKDESEIPEYMIEYAVEHNLGIIIASGS